MTRSKDEQCAVGSKFADQYCKPGKLATVSFYGMGVLIPEYIEELYELFRVKYCE